MHKSRRRQNVRSAVVMLPRDNAKTQPSIKAIDVVFTRPDLD